MKLKQTNLGKVFLASALLVGVSISSCKKDVPTKMNSDEKKGIETWKTLEDYPSEITMDNWEQFVYAPDEVLAHFENLERHQNANYILKTEEVADPNSFSVNGPTGHIRFYSPDNSLIPFPGVTVTYCSQVTKSHNSNSNNYSFPFDCNNNGDICMSVNPPLSNSQSCDMSIPLAGVTTLDLVLLQKHILGHITFTKTSQKIAADIDRDGVITDADLLILRDILLGNTSDWEISENYLFIDETNFNNFVDLQQLYAISNGINSCQSNNSLDRIGVKTGDVNGTLVSCF